MAIVAVWIWIGLNVSREELPRLLGWAVVLTGVDVILHYLLKRTALSAQALEMFDMFLVGVTSGLLPALMGQ